MNEIQKCELEILKAVLAVCDKLEIECFLVCGSVIGAVKYQGFVPWDDDIDIGMYREDYEKFIHKAQELLPYYYFVQNSNTDPEFPMMITKIRDNRTTFIEKIFDKINMNHGIGIDIFPLDGYPVNYFQQKHIEILKKIYEINRASKFDYCEKKEETLKRRLVLIYYKVFGKYIDVAKSIRKLNDVLKKYSNQDSEIVCNHGNWQGKLEYSPKWHYGVGKWTTFEDINVRIPENYDEYLTQKYGEWRLDLPEEKKKSGHNLRVVDTSCPYTIYVEKISKKNICIKSIDIT